MQQALGAAGQDAAVQAQRSKQSLRPEPPRLSLAIEPSRLLQQQNVHVQYLSGKIWQQVQLTAVLQVQRGDSEHRPGHSAPRIAGQGQGVQAGISCPQPGQPR